MERPLTVAFCFVSFFYIFLGRHCLSSIDNAGQRNDIVRNVTETCWDNWKEGKIDAEPLKCTPTIKKAEKKKP